MSEDPSTLGKALQIGATGDLGGRIAERWAAVHAGEA